MTHYLLNNFDVRFIFAKPCAKRMAKNMATEVRDDNGFSIPISCFYPRIERTVSIS